MHKACGFPGFSLPFDPTLAWMAIEQNLTAFDAVRVKLRGIRRPRHVVPDIRRGKWSGAVEFDSLVLLDHNVGIEERRRKRVIAHTPNE